jgi:hypothetical protein
MEELHEHARQMIAEQQRFEAEIGDLRAQSIEEREELRRQHEEEIEAWQQKAAALQAEVAALQKARRQQRKQQREMSALIQTAAATADEASEQLRSRRNRLELQESTAWSRSDAGSTGAPSLELLDSRDRDRDRDEDSDAVSTQSARSGVSLQNAAPDAQLEGVDDPGVDDYDDGHATVVDDDDGDGDGAAEDRDDNDNDDDDVASDGIRQQAPWSSEDEEEMQVGYSTCVEPPEPEAQLHEDRRPSQPIFALLPGPSPVLQSSHHREAESDGCGSAEDGHGHTTSATPDSAAFAAAAVDSRGDAVSAAAEASERSHGGHSQAAPPGAAAAFAAAAAETPAPDRRRRDRRRFLAATEGLPGSAYRTVYTPAAAFALVPRLALLAARWTVSAD